MGLFKSSIDWAQSVLLQATDSALGILGSQGNFFASLPNVLKGAIVLDTETSGIGDRQPIIEAAIKDIASGEAITYHIAPSRIVNGRIAFMTDETQLDKVAQPWFKERMKTGGQFAYVNDYFLAIKNPSNRDLLRKQGYLDVEGRRFLSVESFFTKFAADVKDKPALLAANLQFESRQMGYWFTYLPNATKKDIREMFHSYSPSSRRFLFTDIDLNRAKSIAFQRKDAQGWIDVGKAYWNLAKSKGIISGDILDPLRSMLGQASQAGVIGTRDFFTGLGMETTGMSMALLGKEGEAHQALKDTLLQAEILQHTYGIERNLASLNESGIRPFLSNVYGLLSGDLLKSVRAVQKVESIQPMVKEMRLKQQLAHLELERRLALHGPDSIGGELDPFKISSGVRRADIETVVRGDPDRIVSQEIFIPKERPLREAPNIEKAISQYVADIPNVLLHGNYPELEKRVPSMVEEMRSLDNAKLWELYQPTTDPRKAAEISEALYATINNARTWSKSRLVAESLKAHKLGYAGLAIAGLVVGNAIVGAISGRDDAYNTIEGLRHGGLASDYRRSYAFGSGWLGLDAMQDLGFGYDPNVYSNIRELRQSRSTLEERSQAARNSSSQEGSRFTSSDFTYSGLAKSIIGVNPNNPNIQELDLSRFSLDVEDADTLVLKRTGIAGLWSDPLTIRLAGVDAPEISHPDQKPSPYKTGQQQPGGQRSKQILESIVAGSDKLQLLVDPTNTTYGRSMGILVADGININLAMVAKGVVSSLEYGPRNKDVTDRDLFRMFGAKAESTRQGIWQLPFYQAIRQYNAGAGRDITFNSLTDVVRMAEDPTLEALYTAAWTNMTPPGMTYQLGKASRIRGRGGDYNSIEGLTHSGMASELRNLNTDFGSPWQGLKKFFSNVAIKLKHLFSRATPNFSRDFSSRLLNPEKLISFPTKSVYRSIETNTVSAAGFVTQNKEVLSKVGLETPIGAIVAPDLSYGTKLFTGAHELGHILSTLGSKNGLAHSAWSPEISEYISTKSGQKVFSKIQKRVKSSYKDSANWTDEYLHNITREELYAESIGVLYNPNVSTRFHSGYIRSISGKTKKQLGELGQKLHDQARPFVSRYIPGSDDAYNVIEGLRHGGEAERYRKVLTDFGSGFDKVKQLAKLMNIGFEDLVKSKEFQQSIDEAISVKELGRGLFGKATLRRGNFRGEIFEFVSKTPNKKVDVLEHIDILANASVRQKVSSMSPEEFYNTGSQNLIDEYSALSYIGHDTAYTPSVYGLSNNALHMEYMPGSNVTTRGKKPTDKSIKEFAGFIEAMAHSKNILNKDVHRGNLLYDQESQRISWIDFADTKRLTRVTPKDTETYIHSISRAHEALTYGKHEPSYETELFVQQFKPLVPKSFAHDSAIAYASTIADDDAHNTIEGIVAGAGASASRTTMGTTFGSGWHREPGWVVEYYLSQTQNTLGDSISNYASELYKDLIPDGLHVPGAYDVGIRSLYQTPLSTSFYSASREAELLIPNTSGQGGNGRVQNASLSDIEAFTHSGMSGATRLYNTGFGSGWKGLEATLQASEDFANIGGAATSTLQNHPMPSTSHMSFGYQRYTKPTVVLQTKSPMRPNVDRVQTSLQGVNSNRRVKDYYRKLEMAKNQELASRSMFLNAKYGAKQHIKQQNRLN